MSQIFISYRRKDSKAFTERLYQSLLRHYRSDQIFMDVDNIFGGQNFVKVLERTLHRCDTLLAVIGPEWVSMENDKGRRIVQRYDFVRQEVHTALKREITVIPVLFDETPMPAANALPPSIRDLHVRQAVRILDDRFDNAVDRLVEAIELGRVERQQARRVGQRRALTGSLPVIALGALIGALALAVVGLIVGLVSAGTGVMAIVGLLGGAVLGFLLGILLAGFLQVVFLAIVGLVIGTVLGGPIGAPVGLVLGIGLGLIGVSGGGEYGRGTGAVLAGGVGALAGAVIGFHLLGSGEPVLAQLVRGGVAGWQMAGWLLLPGAAIGSLVALGVHAARNRQLFQKAA